MTQQKGNAGVPVLLLERLWLSARGFDRVRRVARTIADLAGAAEVGAEHVSEAVPYREAGEQ